MLRKQQFICKQACPPIQRALGADPRKLWKVIAFRKMRQNHIRCLAVVVGFKKVGSRLIRQVPDARQNPLFHRPGIGPVAQHLEIVVGFQQSADPLLQAAPSHWAECSPDRWHRPSAPLRPGKQIPPGRLRRVGMVNGLTAMSPISKAARPRNTPPTAAR